MGMDLGKMGEGVKLAEQLRDKTRHTGFIGGLFRGNVDFRLLNVKAVSGTEEQALVGKLVAQLQEFLPAHVDPNKIDRENEVPNEVFAWLCDNGFFGLKVPKEFGGHGLHQTEYSRVLGVVASWTGSLAAPLSAANTIGLSYPLKYYGTEEQKKKWLPIVAKVPTGFAFTEAQAGSDPANMSSYGVRVRNEKGEVIGYRFSGTKWWTTNGPKSDTEFLSPLLCVIVKAVDKPEDLKDPNYKPVFIALIVPTDLPGIKIVQRCDFAGLNGICNGVTEFKDVYIPIDQRIGKEGDGFKIALQALTTGRLSIASLAAAVCKQAVLMMAWQGKNRVQWGRPIVQHEMIGSGMIASSLAKTFAMEAMTWLASRRVDEDLDCRLEAAVNKVFSTEKGWEIMDAMMQLFGGRGYETADSLAKRGEPALPVERLWRDFRINRTFEGSSELLTLYTLREGSDEYKTLGEIFFEKGNWVKKAKAALWFAKKIVSLMVPQGIPAETLRLVHPKLHRHLQFVEKYSRKLALTLILCSAKYQAKFIHKQLIFQRLMWMAAELYAMAAVCHYAALQFSNAAEYVNLTDYYCRDAEIKIKNLLRAVKENTDAQARAVGKQLLDGQYDAWLKKDIISIPDYLKLK
jgi:alkylation response protein AidB-like acyl-CoA dehydrogenase